METEIDAPHDGQFLPGIVTPIAISISLLGLLIATSFAEGRDLGGEYISAAFLISLSAMLPACAGRATNLIPLNSGMIRAASLSLVLVLLSLVANWIDPSNFNHMFVATFVTIGLVTSILNESERFEESALFLSTILGMRLAAFHAAHLGIAASGSSALVDIQRASIGSAFFSFWLASISLGVVVMVLLRGTLENRGKGSMFSSIPFVSENREVLAYPTLIFIGFLVPVIWVGQISDLSEFSQGSHLGVVWAIFSSVIVLLFAFFRAEGWHVLSSMLAINWVLYTIGHLHEIGNELPSLFSEDGFIGSFTWFFLGFWLNFFAIFFASRGAFGEVAPRRDRGGFRIWWEDNSYPVMVAIAFIVALVVRTAWNVIPAMNASGTGLWDMTGGSDPWYMKRVVDYVIAERSHLIFDHDRAYPSGGINPRPPLFSWSLALGALALSWLLEISPDQAVWWSMSALPAIYGALIVLPIAGIATRAHSKRSGIFAAWLIALMPGHMSRSTFAMSDHDSFAMLFLAIAFYFWMRALENLEHKQVFEKTSTNPLYILAGMRDTWKRNPALMANATMSGIAFSVMALGWKGFVYGPGILFLAYSFQVAVNIFRRKDSLQFTSAALQMMITSIIIPAPFYAWPGMNLLFAPSGMQPMFYIVGFTFAVGWVSSSFRDKPWLLVVMGGTALFGSILAMLFSLQYADLYNGWDILFTGGFYFSKNKIFGTIGEAQAPDRGVLFASYGPIVALIAIGCSFVLLWRGSRKSKSGLTLLGLWTIIATYMAWTAGRFIINATPAMAVAGGIGISMLWGSANLSAFTKVWRNSGIGTPRSRFKSLWPATKSRPGVPAMIMVLLLISSQHATYGVDSGIPRGEQSAYEVDQSIYEIAPDILRQDFFNLFSLMNSKPYDPFETGLWYMGTFGPSFNTQGWNEAYEWLSEQDNSTPFSQRPAFVSWWDYGFQALSSGQHPTVADNFQSGIPNSGAMLLSAGQEDTLSLFIATLALGDRNMNGGEMSPEFRSVLESLMTGEQIDEFADILYNGDCDSCKQFALDRTMALRAVYGTTELLHGHMLDDNGIPQADEVWIVVKDGENFGEPTSNESSAKSLFDEARGSSSSYELMDDPSHYDMAGYRYTKDLFEDYYDISTGLHRANAKFGMMRAFLITAFELEDLVDIYHGISSIDIYEVTDYEGGTTTRNHEIRYFAVDNRLYPLGGKYNADYQNYHRGQTTGIFHAPTHLSGLDIGTYITTTYETNQGMMSSEEYQERYLEDIRSQASGASTAEEMIAINDIEYQHTADFFETMVARTYVGYGTSSLGLESPGGMAGDADTPSSWIAPSALPGSPGSYLEGAMSLPGAMMNHFVISNWYDPTDGAKCETNDTGAKLDQYCGTVYDSNRFVKILKYYSGATLEGTVTLDGVGPVPNARILIERDAFSGEEDADEQGNVIDKDSRTFWVPIGSTQADENGEFSFIVPSGKIRVSAFSGETDLEQARTSIMTGMGYAMSELFTEDPQNRNVNPVTGILGNVYGSTWLTHSIVNVSGTDGHSNGQSKIEASISVPPSAASGVLAWSGQLDFNGEPVLSTEVILTPKSDEVSIQPYVASTSNGSMEGDSMRFSGTGEVTFHGIGSVVSQGAASVSEFTGNHTQTVYDNHSMTGDGQFTGRGTLEGDISGSFPECSGTEVPDDFQACSFGDGTYLINGSVNASGRFTSEGISEYTRALFQATFIGSGTFETDVSHGLESYGTVNGTGTFSGHGVFSGPMVSPGSFHIVDALPGEYRVSVDFGDGNVVDISENFQIPLVPSQIQTPLSISGGAVKGVVSLHTGDPITSELVILAINGSSEDALVECSTVVSPPCYILPGDEGSFEIGPIIPGSYLVEVDVDDDGFPEISETYVFESDQDLLAAFPSVVPQTSDISFNLTDGESSVNNLQLQFRSENQSINPVNVVFNNDSETYFAELTTGEWILNYTLNEEKQLWQRIRVGSDDISTSFEFLVSQMVNGSVIDDSGKSSSDLPPSREPVSFQEIVFQWEGFSITSITDSNGNFSVILPVGAFVDATVERMVGAGGFMSNGTRFQVSEGMGEVTIELKNSMVIFGSVSVNREGNIYNQGFPGWRPVSAQAFNVDGTTDSVWREEVDELGRFEMLLPLGNWSFSLDAGEMGSSSVMKEVNSSVDVELLILPDENSTVNIDFFIDHEGDNNASNGTPVSYPFQIKPLTSNGSGYSVPRDGQEWLSEGTAQVSLEPGRYRIVVDRANSSADEPFDTLYDTNKIFEVGLDPSEINRSVGFEPLWLVNITFSNESGDLLVNHQVKLLNSESGWVQTFTTDENGRILDYINEGDWVVIVDEFESYSGVFEGLRRAILVSQSTAGTQDVFSTSQLATVNIELTSSPEGSDLETMELIFTSQEGLGSFSSPYPGFGQPLEIRVTPGHWNIEMNETSVDGVRILLENTSLSETGVTVGGENNVSLTAHRLVQISGTVFWDLDDDDSPGFFEGLPNATVNLSSENPGLAPPSQDLVTSPTGAWSIFLPAQSTWEIVVEREGFGTVNVSVDLEKVSVVQDIEIIAGEVDISGSVSYLDQTCISSGHWDVVLIPSHGISRDRVIANKSSDSSGWTGEWVSSVQPGSWVVYAYTSDEEPNCQRLVSISSLEVGVEGATVDSELTIGGVLSLDTRWLDFDGLEHELMEIEDYDLKVEFGPMSWSDSLGQDGTLSLLLETGTVQVSSEFDVSEEGRNVTYSGGQGVAIRAGQDTPLETLSIERVSKQDISATPIGDGRETVQEIDQTCTNDDDGDGFINGEDAFPDDSSEWSDLDGDGTGDNADNDDDNDGDPDSEDDSVIFSGPDNSAAGCKYTNADFTISIDYMGHNSLDEYTVVGTVPGADGVHWKVEFENSSSEGDWLDSISFQMGLNNSVLSEEVNVRVTPANVGVAHHFPNGHMVLVKISTQQGYSTQVELTVEVPSSSGLILTDNFQETTYFSPSDNTVAIGVPFRNTGNSDETFIFEFEDSDMWEVAGPMVQPVSPFSDGLATFTLVPVALQDLPSDYVESISFTVTDSSNNSYQFQTTLAMDAPSLSIVGDSVSLLGGSFATYGDVETYSVNISNTGNVDAESVTLTAKLCEEISCQDLVGINSTSSGSVLANSESEFFINMDYTQFDETKKYYILFEIEGEPTEGIEACTDSDSEGKASCVFEAQLWAASDENENLKYMAYVFIVLLVAALLYFTRRPGRRVSAPF